MPTKNPRIKEALESEEDRALAIFAEKRAKSFDRKKALTHEQVWSHLKRKFSIRPTDQR